MLCSWKALFDITYQQSNINLKCGRFNVGRDNSITYIIKNKTMRNFKMFVLNIYAKRYLSLYFSCIGGAIDNLHKIHILTIVYIKQFLISVLYNCVHTVKVVVFLNFRLLV